MDKEKVLLRLDYQIISESLKEDLQRKLFTLQTDFFIVRDPNYQIEEYCPIIDLYYLTDFPKIEREEYRNLQCWIFRLDKPCCTEDKTTLHGQETSGHGSNTLASIINNIVDKSLYRAY